MDGHDLRDLTLTSVRSNVAALLQESLVLDTTAAENIRLGRPEASDDEVRAAARDADADGFLTALPDGYATRLGQRGRRLSAGQRQRVAIARMLLRDAPIVVLDEPSTALDARSAERTLAALRRLMADRTTILISHDLAWVRDADRIVVLDRGRVVEEGTHEALVAANGPYARLWVRSGATPRTEPAVPARTEPAVSARTRPAVAVAAR
jgi:ABC-type multidrug transport system fused ATPase/permease subunit